MPELTRRYPREDEARRAVARAVSAAASPVTSSIRLVTRSADYEDMVVLEDTRTGRQSMVLERAPATLGGALIGFAAGAAYALVLWTAPDAGPMNLLPIGQGGGLGALAGAALGAVADGLRGRIRRRAGRRPPGAAGAALLTIGFAEADRAAILAALEPAAGQG